MANRKIKDQDLTGFEEFIEYTHTKVGNSPAKTYIQKNNEQFELVSFLASESMRLDKLIELFQDKVPVLKNCPQDLSLIAQQETNNRVMKNQIVQDLIQKNSPLNQNLDFFFKQFYEN